MCRAGSYAQSRVIQIETAEAVMSIINDYTVHILSAERQRALVAQAAQDRLARSLRAARPSLRDRVTSWRADRVRRRGTQPVRLHHRPVAS